MNNLGRSPLEKKKQCIRCRVFPQGFEVRVPETPLCGVKGSFNKI